METWLLSKMLPLHDKAAGIVMPFAVPCQVHINAQKPQRPHADVFLEHIRKFQALCMPESPLLACQFTLQRTS